MTGFIVVFDDDQGACFPYGVDADCEGALAATIGNYQIVAFKDRKSAQKAISISTKFAQLRQAQGGNPNTDFLGESRKLIKIMKVIFAE